MNILLNTLTIYPYLTANSWLATESIHENLLILLLFILIVLILIVAIVMYRAVRTVLYLTKPAFLEQEASKYESDKSHNKEGYWKRTWNKFMGIQPMEMEESLVIDDHDFDGIKELDNPIPIWFNALFYATIAFSVVYLLVYHVFGWGLNQDQEYEREMAIAEMQREEYLASSANNIDENTVVVDLSPAVLKEGQALFVQYCAACHLNDGGGSIGPNLADDYWIHGGNISDVFHTIKYGVLDKGMIAWEQSLTPSQISDVSNYIVSLRGTTPATPKDPEGEKFEYTDMDSTDTDKETEATDVDETIHEEV